MADTPAAASQSTTRPAATSSPKPPRRSFKSFFWGSLIGALILIGLYTLFMLWWSYSEGERAGVLQKFSRRGWICKTYEGELAQYIVGGVAPQIWNFSVRDPVVAEQLHKAVGQQVRIRYQEHRGLPTTCFGETSYFADRFEIISTPEPVRPSSGLSVEPTAVAAPAPAATAAPAAPPPSQP
ncbi:MAG: hypothetical protein V9E93_04355 [Steroidobacteraceae bacterium]|nr:hypothetical protein [Pseudomonadota bacterium]MBP6105943.1 hypothetical protein [Steroidobacteraceae bacterium]MBP7013602.1 hypothetical protein [Steroidobacteraceae bacterium]